MLIVKEIRQLEILNQEELSKTDSKIAMPTEASNNEEYIKDMNTLVDLDITDAISGEYVKRILMSSEDELETPNYIMDFSEVSDTTIFQKRALKEIVAKSGDTAIYLYKDGKLMKLGYNESYKLADVMSNFRNYVGDEKMHIYVNVDRSSKRLAEVRKRDITKLRMNI